MPFVNDQMNRTVSLADRPKRIVSLVPSQTELLFDLGLTDEVIGITKFCIHPQKWFREKARVGGTKTVNIEKIKELQPDLIIANKEENVQEQVEALANDFPVWVSDINTLREAYQMIESVGAITGKQEAATHITKQIKEGFDQLPQARLMKAAYLIWKEPYMTVGGDTFIQDMLFHAGFANAFAQLKRYPAITVDDLKESGCEVLLLSSEPYPFKQKHVDELQRHLPDTKVILVDGEMFSWYGSRLLYAPSYFKTLQEQVIVMQ